MYPEPATRILVVEDERHIARFLEFVLQQEGFMVDAVHDGDAALAILQSRRYAAVLLDLGLPGRSGIEVLRHVRSSNQHDETVVIVLTAKTSGDMLQQVMAAGASAHCPKPVAPSTLLRKLKELGVGAERCAAPVGAKEPGR
jgi:DNA-binding response OmpR family regulator